MAEPRAHFQLGIDLDARADAPPAGGAPSTTQAEEEEGVTGAGRSAELPPDHWVVRDGRSYAGRHLIVDLWGAERLDEIDHIGAALRRGVDAAGATLLHLHLHHFTPNGGVSGVAVLAESHISIHSWPERRYAALDVFMCGDTDPDRVIPVLRDAFRPEAVRVTEHLRGHHDPSVDEPLQAETREAA